MKSIIKTFILLLGIGLISLSVVSPALAFPPLPSSFYGKVKVNGANVPDGTIIHATINGKVYAETKTLTYQGDSVYTLDVLGDDTSTTAIEGGHEGDPVAFTVAGQPAIQTGIWKGGTNVNLDLSAGGGAPGVTPSQAKSTSPNTGKSSNKPVVIGIVLAGIVLLVVVWLFFIRKPKL
jgi:LPXTG-motif cell wall-anchored protein